MDKERVDEMFDDSYLSINKELNVFNGLWPNRPEIDKFFRRVIFLAVLIGITLPHYLGIYRQCGKNVAVCAENIAGVAYCSGVLTKYIIPIISREKFEAVYRAIAQNWIRITDSEEKKLMNYYGKVGKIKSITYFGYCVVAGFFFSQMTIIPVVLDYIIPLNESRDKILVTNAEYPFDPYDYYYELYILYCTAAIVSVTVLASTDSMYTVVVEQSLGVFSIVKHRLMKASEQKDDKASYNIIVSAIVMHKQALEFLDLIESTYQLPFLVFIFVTVIFLSFGSIILVGSKDVLIDLIRWILFLIGAMIHIFFISWPGQLVIQYSEDLFLSTYTNKWYQLNKRSKTLIKIMMLRTLKPSVLTAGGFYIMNFENYGSIVKTTLSYVTVALSFD